ncbi:MAG: hypothetical protein K5921_00055 [Lachnospiraceae bacterium]|nr:hypothetical protein [Lachnospiraceae bacterium]
MKVKRMNKKKIIAAMIIVLVILLLIPVPRRLKDGGTIEYNAVLYSVKKVHSLYHDFGYMEGTKVRVLFWNVFDDVELPERLFELTDEDYETIKYVNENSKIGVEFMKSLGNIKLENNPSHDTSYAEQSNEGLVTGKGYYVKELGGVYLSMVEINNNDTDSHILGVKNDDTYSDATAKLEEHGFHYLESVSISSSYEKVIYNKGRIAVAFYYAPNKKKDKNNCKIRSLMVTLYSERPLSEKEDEPDYVL